MRRFLVAAALLLCIGVSGYAQTSSISGTVSDPTSALIPGVTVTATNTGTGVAATSLTNDSGTYNFVSLPPGPYKITAALQGFQTASVTNITLGTAETQRFNITLKLGTAQGTTVDVAVDASTIISQSSSSIGEVLSVDRVRDLPLIGGDVLSLISIMPGVNGETFAGISSNSVNTTRDGLSVSDGRFTNGVYGTTVINPDLVGEVKLILAPVDAELGRGNGQVIITTRSGTNKYTGSVVYNITNSGLNPNSWINNQSGNFRQSDGLTPCAVQQASSDCKWTLTNKPSWFTNHHITGSYGGPIIKNKTFFFALWDQQKNFQRTLTTANVMTETAKQGIFRYFDNWNNGNTQTVASNNVIAIGGSTVGSIPVVDSLGNPVAPFKNSDQTTPYVGSMRCISVFGTVKVDGSPFTQNDCPGGIAMFPATGTAWDPLRPGFDSTGYIARILKEMPVANNFETGDGLNQAGIRFVRGREGDTGANVTTGQDLNSNRWQFNLKIDHNFSPKEKISGAWTYEKNATSSDLTNWPNQVSYNIFRYPQVLTVNATSTLSAALLNEGRFGIRYENAGAYAPWESPDAAVADRANSWFIPGSGDYRALVSPGAGSYAFGGGTNGVMVTGPGQYNGNKSPLYNFADTLSWTLGKHAFKFGAEVRLTSSNGYNNIPQFPWPRVTGGAGTNPDSLATSIPAINTMLGTNRTNAANMNLFLSGSITNATMLYWIAGQNDVPTQFGGTSTDPNGHWQDVTTTPPLGRKYRKTIENEWDAFVKDDWKVTKNLTLNLGLRYEYYGSPYLGDGFTVTSIGQGDGLFGPSRPGSGSIFSNWLIPGNPSLGTGLFLAGYGTTPAVPLACSNTTPIQAGTFATLAPYAAPNCNPTLLTTPEFVGPGTNQADKSVIKNDLNNFGPAVGFSWQVPWFGEGKTTVRGGYQVTYGGSGRLVGGGGSTSTEVAEGGAPGALSQATTVNGDIASLQAGRALTLVDIPALVPVRPTAPAIPGGVINVYGRSANFSSYAADHATPYTQNFTLSMQRNVSNRIQLSISYVGTVAKKIEGSIDTNVGNLYYNKELWDALEITREGGDALLFDQMFAGLDLHGTSTTGVVGYTPVGTLNGAGVLQHGSAHLRRNATFSANLANGNFLPIAETLSTMSTTNGSGVTGTLQNLPTVTPVLAGVSGRVLRNGCDRLANGIANIGTGGNSTTNPLLNVPNRCFAENYITENPQLGTTTYIANLGYSNYHSLQTQVTLRPKQGISYQATWSFVKNLALRGSGYSDLRDMRHDYTDSGSRHSDFRSNGSFELPVGPNKMLLGNSSGWIARVVERWQMNIIYNVTSGTLSSVGASTGLYASQVPDVVGPFNLDGGTVRWNGPAGNGPNGAGTGTSATGTYFGQPLVFTKVPDPQCFQFQDDSHTDSMGFNLFNNTVSATQGNCTLQALQDTASGKIVLQNAQPGTQGNMGLNKIWGHGSWTLDGNLGKTFRISESKSIQVRVDATNVMNHPNPAGPNLSLTGGSDFGSIQQSGNTPAKSGGRTFQGQLRFSF